jgi:predicted amidohydrolase YtcJ
MGPADLLILNARPWSDGASLRGADAIAIAGRHVVAVDKTESLHGLVGPRTRRVNAEGATVTPGFTDAHLHLVAWARGLREVRLEGLRSRAEVVEEVARHVTRHPGRDIVVGRGWAADEWEAPPDRGALDAVVEDRPVLLHSKDFHSLWVNGAALSRAGITTATPEPAGGRIERRPSGEPTGVFREHAVRLFDGLITKPAVATDLEVVRAAAAILLEQGVTMVHDFEGDPEAEVLRALALGEGVRVRVLMHLPRHALDRTLASGLEPGDERFAWGALKLFADGTLGSRTAALFEPYDGTEETGLELIPSEELRGLIGRSVRAGIPVAVHAIGDRAVRAALDAFEACGPALAKLRSRPRIEHAQLVHEDDLPRFAALDVAASMQPLHCTSDRPLVERYWGGRARRAYPWRALLDHGARLLFGSDAPVEWPSAAAGLHAAVTRERPGMCGDPFVPGQRIALDEALRAYTEGPARLAGRWPALGRIAPGSLADLVVWNEDLHHLAPSRLHEAAPAFTILDGEVLFARSERSAATAGSSGARVGA